MTQNETTRLGFSALGLGVELEATLAGLGLTTPTPVQQRAIPLLLAGKDLIASAPTGTGKTAAFLLPAMSRFNEPSRTRSIGPRVLVLTPTRELAAQVAQAAKNFSRDMKRVKTVCVTGGESYREQNRMITAPHEILVATPGRLMDQMQSGRIDFSRLEVLVLDEADRMLDMGFSDDVLAIADKLPAERQTVCFTATLSRSVQSLASRLLRDPETFEVKAEVSRVDAIDQQVVFVDNFGHKRRLLSHWLAESGTGQAIIFMATKRETESLAEALDAEGHATVALHGDLQQRERTRMLNRLRRGEARVLVATDVAARGIDVPNITHVFNFDLPRFAEDYVHRIGRTGRAGATGIAVSFVGRDDVGILRRIERFIGQRVKVTAVEGMEGSFRPSAERPAGSGRPGPRRFDGPRGGGFGDRKPHSDRKPFGERHQHGSERPAFGEARRSEGDSRPRSTWSREGTAAAPARPASDRPYDRERRPAADRPRPAFSDRPQSPWGERPRADAGGERRTFADRKPAGDGTAAPAERRSFGDRKPFSGERKPFAGERPRRKFD